LIGQGMVIVTTLGAWWHELVCMVDGEGLLQWMESFVPLQIALFCLLLCQ